MFLDTRSILPICSSAVISTAMFAFGLRGTRRGNDQKRIRRWPSLVGGVIGVGMTIYVALITNMEVGGHETTIFALPVIAGALVVAIILLRVGFRGRRVGAHPYCSACGFDLFGRPAESNVCNECGTELDGPRAIVIGERQRRMVPLTFGLFVLIFMLALSTPPAVDGVRSLSNVDWNRYKPDAWLIDAMPGKPKGDYRALNELYRRLNDDTLSAASVGKLLAALDATPVSTRAAAYVRPATFSAPIARTAWAHGKLDEATMRQYLQRSLEHILMLAPQTARGHGVRYWITLGDLNLARGDDSAKDAVVTYSHRVTLINGTPLPPNAIGEAAFPFADVYNIMKPLGTLLKIDASEASLPDGPIAIEMRMTATITLTEEGRPTLVETRDIVLTGTTTLVEPATMRCPPAVAGPPHPELPIDDPANTVVPPELALPDPMPEAFADRVEGKWTLTLTTGYPKQGSVLGDVALRVGDHDTPLGSAYLAFEPVVLPLPGEPMAGAQIVITPTPERGADLFEPVATFQLPIVLPLIRR